MINQLIGNYRITAALAEGGMGEVYRGRHQDLPREVVVKTIRLSAFQAKDQEQLKGRFVREAYVQSQLDHPNTVRVYEFFRAEENFYLVMEFIEGMSLRQLIEQQGAIDPAHALPLLKQALAGLAYAHSFDFVDESGNRHTGVIHRDVKPANLLLDGMGRLKITDFGIVKVTGHSEMTSTGFNPGTVEYMSPEQIRGLEVDARSDIYSMGVTFYEVLSGRLPFPPSDRGSAYEVMRGHTELTPPPLSEVKPDVPAGLAKMIMRALEKDPAKRFQTAEEWLAAIAQYESGGVESGKGGSGVEVSRGDAEGTETGGAGMAEKTAAKSPREDLATNVIPVSSTGAAHPPTETLTERLPGASKVTSTDGSTEVLPEPTPGYAGPGYAGFQPAPSARPAGITPGTASPGTAEPQLGMSPKRAAPERTPSQPQQKPNRIGLIVAGLAALLVVAAIAAYFLFKSGSSEPPQTTTATPTEPVAPPVTSTPPPAVVAEDSRLRQAREAEEAESYAEAIKLYEEYLAANPNAADAAALTKQLTELKAFNGHLQIAKVWMEQRDFAEAKKDYAAALKARPSSKAAKEGLAAAEAKLGKKK